MAIKLDLVSYVPINEKEVENDMQSAAHTPNKIEVVLDLTLLYLLPKLILNTLTPEHIHSFVILQLQIAPIKNGITVIVNPIAGINVATFFVQGNIQGQMPVPKNEIIEMLFL